MGRLHKNLSVLLKFSKQPKTPRIIFKKTWFALKKINYLEVDILQIEKKWNRK